MYLSQKLKAVSQVNFIDSTFQKQLWIKVPLKSHNTLLIGCIYRSPTIDAFSSTISLGDLLGSICDYTHLLICGDFNYPNIDWSTMSSNSHHAQLFSHTIQHHYLYQHVHEPTRYRVNSTSCTLDLISTNKRYFVRIYYLTSVSVTMCA